MNWIRACERARAAGTRARAARGRAGRDAAGAGRDPDRGRPGTACGLRPTAGLAALAAVWLTGVLAVCPRRPGLGDRQIARSWWVGYYAGLLVLLSGLVVWSPWFMLVPWTACVYAFVLFEGRWAHSPNQYALIK